MRKPKQQQTTEAMPERLSNIQETSAFPGIPVATLYHWHYCGDGPQPYKVGRHLRYDPRAVMRWLESTAA